MQSQIEYELDILKNKNYDHARQFIEHLVNVLTRTSTAASSNANEINTIEQLCESNNCLWAKEIPIKNLIFYFIYKERGLSNINALHKCQSPFIFKIDPPQTRFLK